MMMFFAEKGNTKAMDTIAKVQRYYHQRVKVVKGRKVPIGTEGICFWMGEYDNSKYDDPWGIYTATHIGIRDDDANVYWTSLNNVELA